MIGFPSECSGSDCTSNTGGIGSVLVRELRFYMRYVVQPKKKKKKIDDFMKIINHETHSNKKNAK